MLDTVSQTVARLAFKGADGQFWFDLSCPRDSSLDRHDLAQVGCLEVPNLVGLRQVIDCDLEEATILDLVAQRDQESLECLSKVRLEPHVLL